VAPQKSKVRLLQGVEKQKKKGGLSVDPVQAVVNAFGKMGEHKEAGGPKKLKPPKGGQAKGTKLKVGLPPPIIGNVAKHRQIEEGKTGLEGAGGMQGLMKRKRNSG